MIKIAPSLLSADFLNFKYHNTSNLNFDFEKQNCLNILNAYYFARNNFLKQYANSEIWPKHYKKISLYAQSCNSRIAFLKYNLNKQLQRISNKDIILYNN